MKKILLAILASLFLSVGYAQHVLTLKNGNIINGKLCGYKKDSIVFDLQGNKLKFKTGDVVSIFFDEKATLKTNLQLQKEQGTIKGVVTYHIPEIGDKPDLGTRVYIIPVDSVSNSDFELVSDTLETATTVRNIYLTTKKYFTDEDIKKRNMQEGQNKYGQKLIDYNVESEEKFNLMDSRANKAIHNIRIKSTANVVVDANGTYEIAVKPGNYYILIWSNNKKGTSLSERYGKIYLKNIKVEQGGVVNESISFSL